MSEQAKVGFIGLGMMGYPMAARVAAAGNEVFVQDADENRIKQFIEEHGGKRFDESTAKSVSVVITMLPNSKIVETVLLGGDGKSGWASKLSKESTVIDMSSSEPARSRDLAQLLKNMGLQYLDAPVSGGVARAVSGKLAILVGGDSDLLERERGLLSTMGTAILHIGPAGAGHAAKALNNYVSAAGLVATVEALQIAKKFGIEPAVMTDVLNSSSGRSNTSENKVKQFMLSESFGSGFALQLMTKDLNIAFALSEAVGYEMQMGASCVELWNKAAAVSTPATDHTEMYRILAEKL
ncbi:3-hydroxyisobutyrate dehydrogenase [Paraburkholderia fungorum]|jgi:3-hydroxyisobutyrate dehydrogenase|uniref:NAD(P)-dependent oxidoreductase n=1 Tax=Paraburkholderia fungorum TaxID=134537 RepID=UPI000D052BFF|nr:NAD(P)-dependent oxidoreductase [Paraburkholderia fungorum]PRZ44964.1 3-hydroxyisobutyrate dehydrogenase [Paraburkholderia fungorum]